MTDLRTNVTGSESAGGVHAAMHNAANAKINTLVNAVDVVLTSPNGTEYLLVVDNNGVLSTTVVVP